MWVATVLGLIPSSSRDLLLVVAVGEQGQHLELARRHIRSPHAPVAAALRAPLHEPTHPRHELVELERLHDEIVGPDQKTRHPVDRLRPLPRHQEHRQPLAIRLPELTTQLIARHIRQPQLEQHKRRRLLQAPPPTPPRRYQSNAPGSPPAPTHRRPDHAPRGHRQRQSQSPLASPPAAPLPLPHFLHPNTPNCNTRLPHPHYSIRLSSYCTPRPPPKL